MGRIITYIMENKKCLKPPTRNSCHGLWANFLSIGDLANGGFCRTMHHILGADDGFSVLPWSLLFPMDLRLKKHVLFYLNLTFFGFQPVLCKHQNFDIEITIGTVTVVFPCIPKRPPWKPACGIVDPWFPGSRETFLLMNFHCLLVTSPNFLIIIQRFVFPNFQVPFLAS